MMWSPHRPDYNYVDEMSSPIFGDNSNTPHRIHVVLVKNRDVVTECGCALAAFRPALHRLWLHECLFIIDLIDVGLPRRFEDTS
jgi:hypothetical protein